MNASFRAWWRRCATAAWLPATALSAAVLSTTVSWAPPVLAAKACPPSCVSLSTIVHAAGVPTGLRAALEELAFDGEQLAPSAQAALARVADEARALPAKAVLQVRVKADAGLGAVAARAQVAARVKALRGALTQAGVPAARVKISAG